MPFDFGLNVCCVFLTFYDSKLTWAVLSPGRYTNSSASVHLSYVQFLKISNPARPVKARFCVEPSWVCLGGEQDIVRGILSRVHVRNLHPGCKFTPGVYFWPCERGFKNLHPGANLPPSFEVVQIYLRPGAICAHERKMNVLFLYNLIGNFDI